MRQHIVSEIQRLANENGGQAPGVNAFTKATGIIESKWLGKFWARWSDALVEAGNKPISWQGKSDEETILSGLIAACRHYGHFPTNAEINILRQSDSEIPSPKTIKNNFGLRTQLTAKLN